MPSRSFELDPVEMLAVAAIGEPGQRVFFLLARGGAEVATLRCEKFHVAGLISRIHELLEQQGGEPAFDPTPGPPAPAVGEPDWVVGEMGLGYHESKRKFVIVAREAPEEEQSEPATARFWVPRDRVQVFARQAEQALSGGRPICTYCGLAIDPAGHPCPAQNGSRPIF